MPHTHERLHKLIPDGLKRHQKLTQAQKSEIRENAGQLSTRKLAALYGVSRRTIMFILDPAKLEANKEARRARGGHKQYYDVDKHREAIKKTRYYRTGLDRNGLLEKQ